MAGYVARGLLTDEKIIYQAKLSMWALLPQVVLGLLVMRFWGIGLLFWVGAILRYYTTELAITNTRVVAKFGFIRRNSIEINVLKIESVQVHQGILGRAFNFGSIVLAGAGNPQIPIPGISNPMRFRQMFIEEQARLTGLP